MTEDATRAGRLAEDEDPAWLLELEEDLRRSAARMAPPPPKPGLWARLRDRGDDPA